MEASRVASITNKVAPEPESQRNILVNTEERNDERDIKEEMPTSIIETSRKSQIERE